MKRLMIGVQCGHATVASVSVGPRGVHVMLCGWMLRMGPTAEALYSVRHAQLQLHAGPWLVSLRRS